MVTPFRSCRRNGVLSWMMFSTTPSSTEVKVWKISPTWIGLGPMRGDNRDSAARIGSCMGHCTISQPVLEFRHETCCSLFCLDWHTHNIGGCREQKPPLSRKESVVQLGQRQALDSYLESKSSNLLELLDCHQISKGAAVHTLQRSPPDRRRGTQQLCVYNAHCH